MSEKDKENVLLLAILMVTRDDVMTCADELGMPRERVTDSVIKLVKERVSQGLGAWREVMKDMVKEVIGEGGRECPLGMVCSPSCAWHAVGGCVVPTHIK